MLVRLCLCCLLPVLSSLFVTGAYAAPPTKDLYYFVIDRSQSIGDSKLVEPFRKHVVNFVGKLDPETQVDIVFFNNRATSPRSWYPMDLRAKGEFGKYFDDYFRPSGQTLLYATVADVLSRVLAKEKDYRNISIVILSDGEDSQLDPRFTKWDDVEKLLPEKWAKQRKGLSVIWAAVEFDPPQKDKPAPDSIVRMLPNLDRTEIERVFSPPPRAAFTANPTKVKVGEPVLFALFDDTGVTSVKWTFGDGADSSKKTASHQYTAKGNYDVSVAATGLGGTAKADMKGYVQVVEEVPLEGRFSWHPALVRIGEKVKFTDESLGAPSVWKWECEGAGSETERNPTVAFTKPGKAKVTLTVAKEGASHLVQQELEVLPLPPDANFTAEPSELEMGQVLKLTVPKNETELTHTWVIGGDVTKAGDEVNWTADKLGRVEVQHAVQGPGGLVEKTFTVFVKEKPSALIAKFKWSPNEVTAGEKVQLVDESAGAPDAWTWEVAGVGTYREHNPTVVFGKPGPYKVTLTVSRKGLQHEVEKSVTVLPRVEPVVAKFVASKAKGRTPVEVRFTDKSKGEISRWSWDFGDGTTSDVQNPSHEYTRPGSYRPRLTVTDTQGRTSKSPGDVAFQATGPLPWYWKGLIGLALAVILWLLVVVPVAKVFILPHQGSRLFTTGPNRLREKALANSSIWWPVGYVKIGGSPGDNIKLMITDPALQNKSLAVVARIPFTRQYTLRAKQSAGVQIQVGSGSSVTRKDVKTGQLKPGTVFYVAKTQFRFELS